MSGPRTAREALLAELMGDMDKLIERQEQATAAANAAAERLEAAATTITVAAANSAEAAKVSVGEFITRRVNDATRQAAEDARKAIDEAAAAAVGKAVLASRNALTQAQPEPPAARPWPAFAAGAAVATAVVAAGALLAWVLTH